MPCRVHNDDRHKGFLLQIITEWEEGASKCRQLFKDREGWRTFADKLVAIAVCTIETKRDSRCEIAIVGLLWL